MGPFDRVPVVDAIRRTSVQAGAVLWGGSVRRWAGVERPGVIVDSQLHEVPVCQGKPLGHRLAPSGERSAMARLVWAPCSLEANAVLATTTARPARSVWGNMRRTTLAHGGGQEQRRTSLAAVVPRTRLPAGRRRLRPSAHAGAQPTDARAARACRWPQTPASAVAWRQRADGPPHHR